MLGPFDLGGANDAAGWQQQLQQVQQQIAAAMSAMGPGGGVAPGGAGAAPGAPAGAAGAAGGAAAPGGASPFNFANLFGGLAGGAGRAGGRGDTGGHGTGAPQDQPWMANRQVSWLPDEGGSHLLDGLELLLEQMEEEAQQAQQAQQQGQGEPDMGVLPSINHLHAGALLHAPAAAWRGMHSAMLATSFGLGVAYRIACWVP